MGVEVTIEDGWATVRPATAEVARKLLAAAPRRRDVQTTTRGPLAFLVEERVAIAAGLVDGAARPTEQPKDSPGPVPEPVTGPPNRGSSRAKWREFFDRMGVEYDEGDTRNNLADKWARA